MALGALSDPAARPALVLALQDPDPGIRKTAAHAIGELGGESAVPALQPLLGDPVADVRWNAALSLSRLGSQAGVPVLFEMMDRDLIGQVPEITAAQAEEVIISAIVALGITGVTEAQAILQDLSTGDPSLKVRQAALEALKVLG